MLLLHHQDGRESLIIYLYFLADESSRLICQISVVYSWKHALTQKRANTRGMLYGPRHYRSRLDCINIGLVVLQSGHIHVLNSWLQFGRPTHDASQDHHNMSSLDKGNLSYSQISDVTKTSQSETESIAVELSCTPFTPHNFSLLL